MSISESRDLRRARKASERALLGFEAAALLRIRASVQHVAQSSPAYSAADAIGVAHRIEDAVARDVLLARTASRRESAHRFAAELDAAGHPVLTATPRRNNDAAAAAQVAKSYAAAWLAAVLSETQERSPREALLQATAATDYRLKTIAATEVPKTFTAERETIEMEYVELHERQLLVLPLKIWWAALDNTCPRCFALHGTVRLFGMPFPGGDVPGAVHPNCHCYESVVPISLTREENAAA